MTRILQFMSAALISAIAGMVAMTIGLVALWCVLAMISPGSRSDLADNIAVGVSLAVMSAACGCACAKLCQSDDRPPWKEKTRIGAPVLAGLFFGWGMAVFLLSSVLQVLCCGSLLPVLNLWSIITEAGAAAFALLGAFLYDRLSD